MLHKYAVYTKILLVSENYFWYSIKWFIKYVQNILDHCVFSNGLRGESFEWIWYSTSPSSWLGRYFTFYVATFFMLDPDKYIRIIYIIFYFRILGICRNVDMFGYFLFHPCKRFFLVIQPYTTMDFRRCTWWVYTAWKQSVVINSNFRNGFQYRVFQFLWIDRY